VNPEADLFLQNDSIQNNWIEQISKLIQTVNRNTPAGRQILDTVEHSSKHIKLQELIYCE